MELDESTSASGLAGGATASTGTAAGTTDLRSDGTDAMEAATGTTSTDAAADAVIGLDGTTCELYSTTTKAKGGPAKKRKPGKKRGGRKAGMTGSRRRDDRG